MAYTISKSSWHFKLYRFHQWFFKGRSVLPERICLCPYMRTLLIWLPLKVLLSLTVLGAILTIIGYFGYQIWIASTVAGWIVVAKIIGGVLLGIALIIGIFLGVEVSKDKFYDLRYSVEHYEPKSLVGQWLKSIHGKICPCFDITE